MKSLIVSMIAVSLFGFGVTPVAAGAPASPHGSGQHAGDLVNINSASADDLKQLPGISDATAKKIVQSRPYKRKDDLVTKQILSLAAYDSIKDHITAGPGTK
jgi:DNA uptake protein ComE-like DNA-binding protein